MRKYIVNFSNFSLNEGIFGKKKEPNRNLDDVELKNFGLDEFVEQFIKGLDNPIIMSVYNRMLDTNSFVKFGRELYSFTDDEKEKLEKIKPLLDNLVNRISKIKEIQRGG